MRLLPLLAAAALAAPAGTAGAQLLPKVRVGVAAGVNLARVTQGVTGDDGEVKARTGLIVGGSASLGIAPGAAVETGLYLSQQGTKVEDTFFGADVESDIKITYVQIPLLLRLTTPVAGPSGFRPFGVVGGAVGLETGCSVTLTDGDDEETLDCDDPDIELNRRSTDFSALAGVGAEVGRWTFQIRYLLGLRTIDTADDPDDIRHRVLSIMAGFTLPTGPSALARPLSRPSPAPTRRRP